MMSGQPSRTLLGTAIKRAEHQLLDTPLIFEDPIILDLVPELADPAAVAEFRSLGEPLLVLLRSLFAMRSRFAEDRLAEAIRRGVRQYVMVGAGLDTFPWRQTDFSPRYGNLRRRPSGEFGLDPSAVARLRAGKAAQPHPRARRPGGLSARGPIDSLRFRPRRGELLLGAWRRSVSERRRHQRAAVLRRFAETWK